MNPVETLGLALGAGFSSGLNLYATIATLGLLQRFGVIHLPESLQVLSHPWVLGIAIAFYAIEFLADKIPYVDSVWDAIHTVIRPPAAGLLAYGAAGGVPPEWRWGAALLAGGVALTSHGTKASARAAVNASPEPFSNWTLSFGGEPPEWRWGAALLAGGVALTSHGTKASARAAVNASPEPFSNWTLSFGEDV